MRKTFAYISVLPTYIYTLHAESYSSPYFLLLIATCNLSCTIWLFSVSFSSHRHPAAVVKINGPANRNISQPQADAEPRDYDARLHLGTDSFLRPLTTLH